MSVPSRITCLIYARIIRADDYAMQFRPDVVKLDVEGFELDVLKGMSDILLSGQLKPSR
jgi:FkbM family methyltransferase